MKEARRATEPQNLLPVGRVETVALPGSLRVTRGGSRPLASLSLPICEARGLDNGLKNPSGFAEGFRSVKK